MSWIDSINNYGIIENLKDYMEKNYPGSVYVTSRNLNLKNFIQKDFKEENNCVIASITRIIDYHRGSFPIIPEDYMEIYEDVLEEAKGNLFDEIRGVFPNRISRISKRVLEKYGVGGKCRGVYFGNFYTTVKKQIDLKNPLMMNIALGKYGAHTVTITGYSIYNYNNMEIKLLHILDGWSRNLRYINYTDFTHGILSINGASFNIIEPFI